MSVEHFPNADITDRKYQLLRSVFTSSDDTGFLALGKRRQWMRIMGFPGDEIEENCRAPANMDEEIISYNAACQLEELNKRIDGQR